MEQNGLDYKLDILPASTWLFVTPDPAVKASFPYLQEIGDFSAQGEHYTARKYLDSYSINYSVSGEGALEYEGDTYTVHQGQAWWIDCRKPHRTYTAKPNGEWHTAWLHYNGKDCAAYYNFFRNQNNGCPIVTLPQVNQLQDKFLSLISIYKKGKAPLLADMHAAGILNALWIELINATATEEILPIIPDIVSGIREYLLEHYSEHITLEDLSAMFNLNKFYLLKLFRRYTGYTPNEFLTLSRINTSKELLRTTFMSVGEIAAQIGLENCSYFIKLFKKYENTTPSRYRESWLSGN